MARGEAQRIGVDYDYEVLAWPVVGALDASEFGPWLDFAGRRWVAGQRAELEELSTELTEESSALALQRVAALSDDLARVVDADLALLDELAARHTGDASSGGAIARLYAELLRSAAVRREQLQPQKPVTSANGSKPDVDERPRRQSESESVP